MDDYMPITNISYDYNAERLMTPIKPPVFSMGQEPVMEGQLGYFFIYSQSEHKEEAEHFLNFYAGCMAEPDLYLIYPEIIEPRENSVYQYQREEILWEINEVNEVVKEIEENGENPDDHMLLIDGTDVRYSDYLAELNVFKSDNTKKYEYNFADYYVNNVSINKDGTRAALSGASANEGSIISVIYILDFSQGNYLQKYEFDDSYIYDIEYLDNGNVIAVGSETAYFIDVEKSKKTDIPYSLRTLTNFEISPEYGLTLSLSTDSDGHHCDIICINAEGKHEAEFSTDNRVFSIDMSSEKIAVLTQGNLGIYDHNGKSLQNISVDSDAKKACFADKKNLYILGTSRISKVTTEEQ